MPKQADFPPGFFERQDEADDARFYTAPRFVVHIDADTIQALTQTIETSFRREERSWT